MIRRSFLKGIAALFVGFIPQRKLHTDLEYAHINGPYPRWQLVVYLDGKPLHFCQEANAKEGWADVFVPAPIGNRFFVDEDGKPIVRRLRGKVQILFVTPELRAEFDRTDPFRTNRVLSGAKT